MKGQFKYLLIGTLVGTFFGGMAINAFASNDNSILATLDKNIKFVFNKEAKELQDDYGVLIYNDHTYVPTRFIAEGLDANIEWNAEQRIINIDKVNEINIDKENKEHFNELPYSITKNGVKIEVYALSVKNDRTYVYLRVKNTTDKPMNLDQLASTITVENINYKHSDVDEDIYYRRDNTWYNDIREDETKEGFIMLPPLPKEAKNGSLYLKMIQNDGTQIVTDFELPIIWNVD